MNITTITSKAPIWSMEGDCMLFQWMEQISQNLEAKSFKVCTSLSQLNTDINQNIIALDNVTNNLSSLQHTQFVENRCQEDDSDLQQVEKLKNTEVASPTGDTMSKFLTNNMNVINKCSMKYALEFDDSDDENENSYIYQLKNPYNERLLPHIYGTKLWHSSSHVGLCTSTNIVEEDIPEVFDEYSSSQVYDTNNSSTCSLSQWASSNSLANESNCFPVFEHPFLTEKTPVLTQSDLSPPDLSDLLPHTSIPAAAQQVFDSLPSITPRSNIVADIPVQLPASQPNWIEPGSFEVNTTSEQKISGKQEIAEKKTISPLLDRGPYESNTKPNTPNHVMVLPTENETFEKLAQNVNQRNKTLNLFDEESDITASSQPMKKTENTLKFNAKNLFDDDDDDDDFLNIFGKNKNVNTKPKDVFPTKNYEKEKYNKVLLEDDMEDEKLFSTTKNSPAYIGELQRKLNAKHDDEKPASLFDGDEFDEGIKKKESSANQENIQPVKKYSNKANANYANIFSDDPPDGFDDLLPVPNIKANEQMQQEYLVLSAETHTSKSEPIQKSTTKDCNTFGLFNEMPPDDDDLLLANKNNPANLSDSPNVQTLMPRMPQTKVASKELNAEKSVLEKDHDYILRNVCKERVRASSKRRPSTRQGRLNNYNQAKQEGESSKAFDPETRRENDANKKLVDTLGTCLQSNSIFIDDKIGFDKRPQKINIEKNAPVTEKSSSKIDSMFSDATADDDLFSKKGEPLSRSMTKSSPQVDYLQIKRSVETDTTSTDPIVTRKLNSIFPEESPPEDIDDIFSKNIGQTNKPTSYPSFPENIRPSVENIEENSSVERKNSSLEGEKSLFTNDLPPEDFDSLFPLITDHSKNPISNNKTLVHNLNMKKKQELSKFSSVFADETPPEDLGSLLSKRPDKFQNSGSSQQFKSFLDDSPTEDFDDLFSKKSESGNKTDSLQIRSTKTANAFFADDSPPEDFDNLLKKKDSLESGTKLLSSDQSIFFDETPPEDFDDLFLKKTDNNFRHLDKPVFADDAPSEDLHTIYNFFPGNLKNTREHTMMHNSSEDVFSAITHEAVEQKVSEKLDKKQVLTDDLLPKITKSLVVQQSKTLEKSMFSDSEDENLFSNDPKKDAKTNQKSQKNERGKLLFADDSESDDDLFGAVTSKPAVISHNPSTPKSKDSLMRSVEEQKSRGAIRKTNDKSLFIDSDDEDDDLFSSTKIVKKILVPATKVTSKIDRVKKEVTDDNPLADLL